MEKPESKSKFTTVPTVIKELDGRFYMDYAITATQKKILGAFRDEREIGEEQSQ